MTTAQPDRPSASTDDAVAAVESQDPTQEESMRSQEEVDVRPVQPESEPMRAHPAVSETPNLAFKMEAFARLHVRLMHRSPEAMREVCKTTVGGAKEWLPGFDDIVKSKLWSCPICAMAKATKPARQPAREEMWATRPLQRVYLDTVPILSGNGFEDLGRMGIRPSDVVLRRPFRERIYRPHYAGQGSVIVRSPQYLLVVVDEFTRYTWVYAMESKGAEEISLIVGEWMLSEPPRIRERRQRSTSHWHDQDNGLNSTAITTFFTDGGTEFKGAFESFCERHKIVHSTSTPYAQWQNGVAEARIRILKDAVRSTAISHGRCEPCDFVHFAEHATAMTNMLPTHALDSANPYWQLYGLQPRMNWYRAYGAECFVYDHRPGTQTRSRRAYVVGVAQSPIEGLHVLNDLTFDQQIVHEATFAGDAMPTPTELMEAARRAELALTRELEMLDALTPTPGGSGGVQLADDREQRPDGDASPVSSGTPKAPEPGTAPDTGAAMNEAATGESNGDEASARGVEGARVEEASTQPDATVSDGTPASHGRSSARDIDAPPTASPYLQHALHPTLEEASCEVERSDEELPHSPTQHGHDELIVNRDDESMGLIVDEEYNQRASEPDRDENNAEEGGDNDNDGDTGSADSDNVDNENDNVVRRSTRNRSAPSRFTYVASPTNTSDPSTLNTGLFTGEEIVKAAHVLTIHQAGAGRISNLADVEAWQANSNPSKIGTDTLRGWLERDKIINFFDGCSGGHSVRKALELAGVAHLFNFISCDNDPSTKPTILMRLEDLVQRIKSGKNIPAALRGIKIHLAWFSPPCTPFSAADTRSGIQERKRKLLQGDKTVRACLELIKLFKPIAWFLENPDSGGNRLARRLILQPFKQYIHTVTYCGEHGRADRKATMIMTNLTNLDLPDCRKPGHECLAKLLMGHHTRTSQAGPSYTADGTLIPGTPKEEAQLVPPLLIQRLIKHAFVEHGDALTHAEDGSSELKAYAVNALTKELDLGKSVRKIADVSPDELKSAKVKEIKGLIDRKVFEIIPISDVPKSAPTLQHVWAVKVREDDTVKARLCVGGHRQTKGVNFWEVSSPTPRSTTVKLALSIAANQKWHVNLIDVAQAYVASDMDVEMYMRVPPELIDTIRSEPNESRSGDWMKNITDIDHFLNNPRMYMTRVRKALYGAKQSGRLWFGHASEKLIAAGYVQCSKDPCVFSARNDDGSLKGIVVMYVDDFLYLGSASAFNGFHKQISKDFDVTIGSTDQRDVKVWNGLEIRRLDDGRISVTQVSKIREMAREYKIVLDGLDNGRKVKAISPEYSGENNFDPNDGIDPNNMTHEERETLRLYQSMVGSIMYVATYTRFDVAHALAKASRLMHRASIKHIRGIARVMRYLVEHEDLALIYDGTQCMPGGTPRIFAFVDSDYGGEPMHTTGEKDLGRKSTSSIIIMCAGAPIYWKSKLQKSVAISSGEAEFRALNVAMKEIAFCYYFLKEVGYDISYTPVFCDAAVGISHMKRDGNSWLEGTKQYETELSYAFSLCKSGMVVPIKIGTDDNPADLLTKSNMRNNDVTKNHIDRISGNAKVDFSTWVRRQLLSFDGTSMPSDGFLHKEQLLALCGV